MTNTMDPSIILLKNLPADYSKIAAEKCGVTRQTVYKHLNNLTKGPVLDCLIELAEKEIQERKALEDRIKGLEDPSPMNVSSQAAAS